MHLGQLLQCLYRKKKLFHQDYMTEDQTCALYSAHQRLEPATAGGWSVGVGVCVRPSQEVSRVFRYPNFLSRVTRSKEAVLDCVMSSTHAPMCTLSHTHWHTDSHKTAVLSELICFHLPSLSSTLVFAAERSLNQRSLYLLTGFHLLNQPTAAAVTALLAF